MSQRKRGKVWQYVIEQGEVDGKRRQIRASGFKTKKAAAEAEAKRRIELGQTLVVGGDRITVAEYLATWLGTKKALNPRTLQRYEMLIRLHINPVLGAIKLQALRPLDIVRCYESIQSDGSRKGAHANILKPALDEAVSLELIGRNPAHGRAPEMPPQEERRFATEEEIARVLALGDETPYGVAYRLAIAAGLRISELLGLRWQDIEGNVVWVRQQAIRGIIDAPKTKKSVRSVTVGSDVLALLAKHRRRQLEDVMAERLDYDSQGLGLVFANEMGNMLSQQSVRRTWKRVAAEAGVAWMNPHDLRHGFATLSLKAGVELKTVSELMGHASMAVTADLYTHVLPSVKEEAALRLEAALREMSTGGEQARG